MVSERITKVLNALEKQSSFEQKNKNMVPHSHRMLSITRDIGMFYNIILKAMGATNVLEIGTSVGYSTIWFADALKQNSKRKEPFILTLDKEENKIQKALKNFESAGISQYIEIRKGEALQILNELKKEVCELKTISKFDFIFIDADKENYNQYFDLSFPLLKKGGLIGADNIIKPKRFQKLMEKYVSYVKNNPKVNSVTIPIDNGEELTIKLED